MSAMKIHGNAYAIGDATQVLPKTWLAPPGFQLATSAFIRCAPTTSTTREDPAQYTPQSAC